MQLVNNTGRQISGVAVAYPSTESQDFMRTYAKVKIEPHGSYRLEAPQPDAPGYGAFSVRGNPEQMEATVIGVRFEDGEVWGSLPPPPPRPALTSGSDEPKLIRKSGWVLTESATRRVVPEPPPLGRAAKIAGSVVVEVIK